MNGLFIVDKPQGVTSHDVVQEIRRRFDTSKVGHLGTLDPMATGVLPVCVGKATRMGQFLGGSPKEYEGEIRFGFSTDTYDREGTPTTSEQPFTASVEAVRAAMNSLTGTFDQTPPLYSAKKIGGVPSHKLARRSQAVEIAPVSIEVQQFELLAFDPPAVRFHVSCSPGTYIRSLAHDLGTKVGCGAHLSALRRTRSGDFCIENAVPLGKLALTDLIPMDRLLESWPRMEVSMTDEVRVLHGNPITGDSGGPFARIFNKKGEFIALASVENGWVRPRVVLTSVNSE